MGNSTESSGPVTGCLRHRALCGDTRIVAPTGRTRVSADALVNDTGAPDVIVPQAANRPHFAGKPSPGLRGGSIQCCVRVQAGPPRAGRRGRARAPPRGTPTGGLPPAVA